MTCWSRPELPQVSNDDLRDFFTLHFSNEALQLFQHQFCHLSLQAKPEYIYVPHVPFFDQKPSTNESEQTISDHSLEYYADGEIRTLTDEQIKIFRHSELFALRRQSSANTLATQHVPAPSNKPVGPVSYRRDCAPSHFTRRREAKKILENRLTRKKRRKPQLAQHAKQEPKADLRKRTWDIVEPGLDSLNYD